MEAFIAETQACYRGHLQDAGLVPGWSDAFYRDVCSCFLLSAFYVVYTLRTVMVLRWSTIRTAGNMIPTRSADLLGPFFLLFLLTVFRSC